MRALHVPTKADRVASYQAAVVDQAVQVIASMGLRSFDELRPDMLRRRIGPEQVVTYGDLFDHLAPGQLYDAPPESWAQDWQRADPDRFTP